MRNFRDFTVWQKSMILAREIYSAVKLLPKEEQYGLSDQIRRAAISIPSNIAEGCARDSEKEFAHFISIAQGSAAELETQLLLCEDIGLLRKEDTSVILQHIEEINKMLQSLAVRLRTSS